MRADRRIVDERIGMAAFLIPAIIVFSVACNTKKEEKVEPAPQAAAVELAAGQAVVTNAVEPKAEAEKVVEPKAPAWPDEIPPTWKIVNDYENIPDNAKAPKMNLWGGYWDIWTYHGGQCKAGSVSDGTGKRLKIDFVMPMDDSECGTYEYLKGPKGKPVEVDIRKYEKVAFMLKSGDDTEHAVRFEVTELDKYDAALQGYTGTSDKLVAGKEWKRHEFVLTDLLHEFFDRRHGKSVGIRIKMKDQAIDGGSGTILIDNIVFMEKAAKATEGKENPK